MDHPGKIHRQTVKWILQYLRGTSHIDLVYDKSNDNCREFVSYVDSNCTKNFNKRRSLIKYVLTLCGNVIS